MNNQLIKKLIESNNEQCPIFAYANPMLDREVSEALSRSFVKILNVSEQSSSINSNLRHCVLENIRRLCTIQPENHVKVDEKFIELLVNFQLKEVRNADADSLGKTLNNFLMKNLKEMYINSSFESSMNPEIVQALVNLNENKHLATLSKDLIHWDIDNTKCLQVMKDLWKNLHLFDSSGASKTIDDISIKMKPEIEKLLLKICTSVLSNKDMAKESIMSSDSNLKNLINTCATSPNCFQISISILNFIFSNTYFDSRIQLFISEFVLSIKQASKQISFSVLYPTHLRNIVLLLDIDIDAMSDGIKHYYINQTTNLIQSLHKVSESDVILVLSHFPQWFNIYFKENVFSN